MRSPGPQLIRLGLGVRASRRLCPSWVSRNQRTSQPDYLPVLGPISVMFGKAAMVGERARAVAATTLPDENPA